MLLRNESKVKHSIDIKLVFDDNTTRELELREGDFVHVSYRNNGCLKHGIGIVKRIEPYLKKYYRCGCNQPVESALIVIDMSENNEACVVKIELCDIIDIKLVYPCCSCPPVEMPPKPQCPHMENCCCKELKPHYSCTVGSVVTNKGVVAHG